MSASDDQMDTASKDWSMMDDHAYISTVEEDAAIITGAADELSEVASFEATTDEDTEPADVTKPTTPTPERIEDIILGKKISKDLKSILELSKEARIDINMAHKRKSVNDSENSGSSERSETPKRANKSSPHTEQESLLDDIKMESPQLTRIVGGKDKMGLKRRADGSLGGATTNTDHKIVKRMPMPPRNSANVRNHKDSFCWQCHRNGVNVNCETCPRSYHTKCVKTPVMDIDHWPCPECVAILTAENVKTRSVAMKDVSLEQLCELLKFAHRRMVEVVDTDPFLNPVNETEFPHYYSYIVQPMDLSTLQKNIRENTYGSTIAFEADAKWILHNSIIFNTYQSKLTSTAKTIVRICKHEMSEIENCYTCYLNANTQKNWFVEVCPKPHSIIWAKLKGFPYWPAKAMSTNNVGMVDCRFFGAHDRAWVSYKDCYLYCQQDPNSNKQKRLVIIECIKEVDVYIENLRKIHSEFEYAPFKTLYDPENELKQLQLLLPKYSIDEPAINKIVPKLKIVAKKTSDTEPTTFKVTEPTTDVKSEHSSASDDDDEDTETDDSSSNEDEVLSSSSDEEGDLSDMRTKRKTGEDDDSDFSEGEEVKVIKRLRSRRRGVRRTSSASLDSLASSEHSDKDHESASKMSDVLMKKLSESNDVGEGKGAVDGAGADDKKDDEIETSFESSEQEDDRSEKEIRHVTGDMDVDEDGGKLDSVADEIEPIVERVVADDDKEENKQSTAVEPPTEPKESSPELATVDETPTKEPLPTEQPDSQQAEPDTVATDPPTDGAATSVAAAPSVACEPAQEPPPARRSSKESTKSSDNPIPELIKLSNFVEATGQKRKKSSDSSSTDSDVVQQTKKSAKVDDDKDKNSTSNGYESIQSILKRQGKTKSTTPQPHPPTDTPKSDTDPKSLGSEPTSSTDPLTIATTNALAEIKSEPVSPEFSTSSSSSSSSSASSDEDNEYTDNRYMMAKLQYLSALNISEKRPLDANADKKQKEIRTRSKTEELTKGRLGASEGMLKNIASYLENAGDEISIHKKRHDHPMNNAIKVLQHNNSVTLKQRARKSFPKPVGQPLTQKSSLNTTATVLSLGKNDPTVAKHSNITSAIIVKGNTVGTASPKQPTGEIKRAISILNTSVAGTGIPNSGSIGAVSSTVATTTTSNLMILTHPQAGSVVLPAGSTLPQSLAPYLSSYYYVTPSTQAIAATTTAPSTGGTATATVPPLSAIQPMQVVHATAQATFDLTSALTTVPTASVGTTQVATSLSAIAGTDSATVEDRTVYDPNILNGLVPENITRAVADLFCKRVPPKLKPRPPGALSSQFDRGVSSDAGPIAAKINSVAHRFTDYFRGMLVETLSDMGGANPEATITTLRLENETMRQKHTEEMLEIKKNVNTLMCDIQKSVSEEKDKIIDETKAKCEQETIRRVNDTKSKQWCANCLKEAQFYCCWNTSYCDYPCQAKHWLKHQYKCTQEMNNQMQGGPCPTASSTGGASGSGSTATGGSGGATGKAPIVLRHSAPPPKGFTGKILKTTSKVLMNSRGNAKIPMNVLRRASNGGGHITIIESTPGNYELVGNGPITLGGPPKNTPQGLMKVKNTGGAAKQHQTLTSNLPPNSKAILLNKTAATSPNINSLMKKSVHKPGNVRHSIDGNNRT